MTIRRRGARFTCSYEEKKRVPWRKRYTGYKRVCRSAWNITGVDPLNSNLKGLRRQITIQWITWHSDILRNEITDSATKQERSENAQLPGVTYTSICARIRHMIKDPQHERTAKVYSAYSSPRECQIRSRRDQTLLAKLRTVMYKGLRAYKSLLYGSDPTYPLCNQEPQDLQYWLQRCQATETEIKPFW